MDVVSHIDYEPDIAILSLTEHFVSLALVAMRADILEFVVNIGLSIVNLARVEAIRDKTSYSGQLG